MKALRYRVYKVVGVAQCTCGARWLFQEGGAVHDAQKHEIEKHAIMWGHNVAIDTSRETGELCVEEIEVGAGTGFVAMPNEGPTEEETLAVGMMEEAWQRIQPSITTRDFKVLKEIKSAMVAELRAIIGAGHRVQARVEARHPELAEAIDSGEYTRLLFSLLQGMAHVADERRKRDAG